MMMLDEKGISYEQWPAKIVVDIRDVDQMDMLDMMEHLETVGVEYSVDEENMYVIPSMPMETPTLEFSPDDYMPVEFDSRKGNETLGLEIELFARKYIPESDDAFGKFMYHAELIKNGHYDTHQMDIGMVGEPYRSILLEMIQKGGM